jgi:hypothetical protein
MGRRRIITLLVGALAGLAAIASALAVLTVIEYREDFEGGELKGWEFPHAEDWEIRAEGGNRYLHMLRNREPGVPRRPLQFARLGGVNVGSFELKARVRREGKSMIIVFNYVNTMHFYYAHLSADRGTEQLVHNGLFLVNGGPRNRIAGLEAEPALPTRGWHSFRIVRNARSGWIRVYADAPAGPLASAAPAAASAEPLFSVQDRTFWCGQIGFGSFDETGDFDDVELRSEDADCLPRGGLRPASKHTYFFAPFGKNLLRDYKEWP